MQGSPAEVALKSTLALLAGAANFIGAGQAAEMDEVGASEAFMQRAGERLGEFGEYNRLRPGPAQNPLLALDATVGAGAVSAARRAPQEAAESLAQRSVRKIAENTAEEGFGGSTVGAAQRGPVRGVQKWLQRVQETLDEPRKFSPDQADILESKLWQEVDFEFPPASLNSEQFYATALSGPGTRAHLEPFLARNGLKLGEKMAAATGAELGPRGFGRGMIRQARRNTGEKFQQVGKWIDRGHDLSENAEVANRMLSPLARERLDLTNLSGQQLLHVRSQANKKLTKFWNSGLEPEATAAEMLIADIDNIIKDQLTGEQLKFWQSAREQWRVYKAFERPGVVDKNTGELSLKSLTNALEKQFPDFFEVGPTEIDAIRLVNKETKDLLKFARVARSFSDALPDSGTATRSWINLLGDRQALARQLVLGRNLRDLARTPEEALALSDAMP